MSLCPICGGDRDKDIRQALAPLLSRHNLQSEHVNPGGRELWFKEKGRLQLFDECASCDEERIRKFLTGQSC
jgi:hypothetical protein